MKDFEKIDTGRAYKQLFEQATGKKGQQTEASEEEKVLRAAELRTQGRKGCKAIRINMAFTPDNHEFIRVLAKASGRNMTELTNAIVEAYRNEHPEFLDEARRFLAYINAGQFSKIQKTEDAEEDREDNKV